MSSLINYIIGNSVCGVATPGQPWYSESVQLLTKGLGSSKNTPTVRYRRQCECVYPPVYTV